MARRIICDSCKRRYYGIWEYFQPNLCPICEDPGRFWCVNCGASEGIEELHGNHYCKNCFPDAPDFVCSECGEYSPELIQDGETYGGDPWIVCPKCKKL